MPKAQYAYLTPYARSMRHEPTAAEKKLWSKLRHSQLAGLHFRRQVPIGPYIADFACLTLRFIIELDGGQHNDNADDQKRDAWLRAQGWQILRFWNPDVLTNCEGVLEMILAQLSPTSSTATPTPALPRLKAGEGELLITAALALRSALAGLRFSAPVTHTYNPLEYGWAAHEVYLKKYGQGRKRVMFLGMNPGPFGMGQTGVPFGEVAAVRDWLGITAKIGKPAHENPKKPVDGFACTRAEVSGARLWGLFRQHYGTPEAFFAAHFVSNYCPLLWLNNTKNVTPVELPKAETAPVDAACNTHLRQQVEILQPEIIVGVGKYARKQAEVALKGLPVRFADILHPSPASPAANKGWAEVAVRQLKEQGI